MAYACEKLRGTGVHHKQLFTWALEKNADEVYYLEGDSKPDLVLPENMELWQSVYRNNPSIDINIPGRSKKTLQTVPTEQRVSEVHGGNIPLDIIFRFDGYNGPLLDVLWGPKAVNKRALPYFIRTYYKSVNGKDVEITDWGHPYVAFVHASHEGMKFGGIEMDTIHPKKRKEVEEGNYDAEQKRLQNIQQIVPVCFEHFFKLKELIPR